MLQVSRASNLKIPKEVGKLEKPVNSKEDIEATRKAIAYAKEVKIDTISPLSSEDADFEVISKIPFNANDLMVITVVKKLGAYVITVTEKSPKKYRGVFVNRMQNYCLDALEYLLEANFIRMDSLEHKERRESCQKEAIIKLKLLGYMAMLSCHVGCILKRQYRQISVQLAQAIQMTAAWKKSDDERWRHRK